MLSNKKNNQQIKGTRLFSFLFFGIFSLLLFLTNGVSDSFHKNISLKFYNTLVGINTLVYGNVSNFYTNSLASKNRIKTLENHLQDYKEVKNNSILLSMENIKLKQEIEAIKSSIKFVDKYFDDREYFFAPIHLKSMNSLHQLFVVNIGEKDGVLETSLALANNGVVGYVYKTYENYSEVLPITANETKIPAFTGQSQINGIIQGNGSLIPIFKSYENTLKLVEGETVYTSGIGDVFDKRVPIGKLMFEDHTWKVNLFSSILETTDIIIVNKKKK